MADNRQRDEEKRGLPRELQNAEASHYCESYHGMREETAMNSSVALNNNLSQTNPLQYAQILQHAHLLNVMILSQQQRDNIISVQQEKSNPQSTAGRNSETNALSDNARMTFTSSYSATDQIDTSHSQWDSAARLTAEFQEFLSADQAHPPLSANEQSSQMAELPATQRAQVPLAMISDLTEVLSRQPAAENSTFPVAAYPSPMPIGTTSNQTARNERRQPPEFSSVAFAPPSLSSIINSARFATSEHSAASFQEPCGSGIAAYLQDGKSLPVLPVRLKRQYRHESFPEKLSRMLKETEQSGQSDVVSYTPSGQAFKVHKLSLFTSEIIPKYFRHKCYPSFRRQLSMYGFQRIQIGPEEGSFAHPFFSREHPELVRHIQRSADRATVGSELKRRPYN